MNKRRIFLQVLLSIASVFSLILPTSAAMPLPDDLTINHPAMALNMTQGSVAPMVAAGWGHIVGLKSDGTVVAVGGNFRGQCDVSGWTDIVQVSTGDYYTVGLKSDGTVVAVGDNYYGQCNLGRWTDIVQIAAGPMHVVGLKSDGTVVAKGSSNFFGERNVGNWTDIIQVAAGDYFTVGLKSDDTVVAVGANHFGECDVGNWNDIVQVAAGDDHTLGLKSDGTMVAVGRNEYGQCDIGGWMDIIQVAACGYHTVGLRSDGTVVAAGPWVFTALDVSNWTDIIQVTAGRSRIVGLKSDGTLVATESKVELAKWNLGIITEHTLTISSTVGGAVTTPGEESFNYTAGAMVHLVAEPDAGYRFVNWTGDVGAIFDVNAATTIIAMTDNYSITANFEEKPPINWALIGGIIGGVVAVGLVIFFVHRRRTA